MRTYYRGPDAVITDTHFVWQSPSVQIFAIDDLYDVRLERTVAAGPSGVEFSLGLGLLILAIAAGCDVKASLYAFSASAPTC